MLHTLSLRPGSRMAPVAILPVLIAIAVVSAWPRTASAEHLYVASSGPQTIVRYPLVNGIPQQPDWTYDSPTLPTSMAIDAQGNLYSAQFQKIDVFKPTDQRPSSEIDIPQSDACDNGAGTYTSAVAINPSGYVAASIDNWFSGMREERGGPSVICQGVATFAAGARGPAVPVNVFGLPGNTFVSSTIDRQDNLYITDSAREKIFEFSHPEGRQRLVRSISGSAITSPFGLATGPAGELYAFDGSTNIAVVDVYKPKESGQGPPARQLVFPKSAHVFPYIAVAPGFLYVSAYGAVDVYRASSSGPATPLFTFPIFSNLTIAVGP